MTTSEQVDFNVLRKGRGYLATPYTKHIEGQEYAYKVACVHLASLHSLGVWAFSPIAHWHTASLHDPSRKLPHYTPDQWLALNKPEMDLCDWMLIPYDRDENWKQSEGIRKERLYFEQCGKPVYFYEGHRQRVYRMAV